MSVVYRFVPEGAEGRLLRDGSERLRSVALRLVTWRESKEDLPAVLELLDDPALRERAIAAVGAIGNASTAARIEPFLQAPDAGARAAAVEAVATLKGKAALRDLMVMCGDPDRFVRGTAIRELSRLGGCGPEVIDLLVRSLRDPEAWVVGEALEALGEVHAADHWEDVTPFLRHSERSLKLAACKALESIAPDAGRRLVAPLLKDADSGVRMQALWFFDHAGLPDDADMIAPLLDDADPWVRGVCCTTLAAIGDAKHVEKIATLLQDRESRVAAGAAEAIATLRRDDYWPEIERLLDCPPLKRDADPWNHEKDLRMVCVRALEEANRRPSDGALRKLLSHPEPDLRRAGLCLLARVGTASDSAVMRDALEDGQPAVRSAAVEALVSIAVPEVRGEVVKVLRSHRDDPEEQVRVAVNRALLALGALSAGDERAVQTSAAGEWERRSIASALLSCHEHGVWQVLLRPQVLRRDVLAREDLLNAFADAGLTLEVEFPCRFWRRTWKKGAVRLLDLLNDLSGVWALIAEGKVIRLVSPQAAMDYWKERLK